MRPVPAVAVAVLLVASGCSSLLAPADGDAETPTLTPAPAPTPEAPYPPGVRAESVSPFELLDAHATVLSTRSYTVVETRTLRDANGSVRVATTERNRVADDRAHYHYTLTLEGREGPLFVGSARRFSVYSNGSLAARRLVAPNGSTDDAVVDPNVTVSQGLVRDPDGGPAEPNAVLHGTPLNVGRLGSLVARSAFAVDRVDDRYRLTATAVEGDRLVVAGRRVENLTVTGFTLTVTERGLVEHAHLEFAGRVEGTSVTGVETIRYEAVGNTTVREPSWFAAAVAGS